MADVLVGVIVVVAVGSIALERRGRIPLWAMVAAAPGLTLVALAGGWLGEDEGLERSDLLFLVLPLVLLTVAVALIESTWMDDDEPVEPVPGPDEVSTLRRVLWLVGIAGGLTAVALLADVLDDGITSLFWPAVFLTAPFVWGAAPSPRSGLTARRRG